MTDERGTLGTDATPGAPWDDDRGDVPGWVLITLMTAGLPVATRIGSSRRGG
jgi:hypothetical protein